MPSITYSTVVDCAHPISMEMPLWPGDPQTTFEVVASLEVDGYFLRKFQMGEHSGTHCNAPVCFFPDGEDIVSVLSSSRVLPLAVANMVAIARQSPDAVWGIEELAAWESEYGLVPEGVLFCLHTGWAGYWREPEKFLGIDSVGKMHFPAFTPEVAHVLVHERNVAGLGIDTHGVDSPADETFAVNALTLKANRLVLECVNNLALLPAVGANAVIGGLKLEGGAGCPVAITAFVP